MLSPAKRKIYPHARMLDSLNEVRPRLLYAGSPRSNLFTPPHRIRPALSIVAGPVLKKELGSLIHGANQMSNLRIDEGDREGSSKSVPVHGPTYAEIAAEVSAAAKIREAA